MSEQTYELTTDQAEREASGAHTHTRVLSQDGVLVAEFKRLVLVSRHEPGE